MKNRLNNFFFLIGAALSLFLVVGTFCRILLTIKGVQTNSSIFNIYLKYSFRYLPLCLLALIFIFKTKRSKIILVFIFLMASLTTGILSMVFPSLQTDSFGKIQYSKVNVYTENITKNETFNVDYYVYNLDKKRNGNIAYYIKKNFALGFYKISLVPNESIFWNDKTDSQEVSINRTIYHIQNPIELYKKGIELININQ